MTDQIGHIPPTIDEIIIDTELLPPECSRVKIGRITDKPELKICVEVDDPIEKTRLHGFETTDAAELHLAKRFNYQPTPAFGIIAETPSPYDTRIKQVENLRAWQTVHAAVNYDSFSSRDLLDAIMHLDDLHNPKERDESGNIITSFAESLENDPPATEESPRFVLSDDGTLDTVILDTKNGEEHRFNYQNSDYGGNYDSFVAWCIEELENDPDIPE